MRYYQLLCLQQGREVQVEGLTLRVALPVDASSCVIENDEQLLAQAGTQKVFYFSGGGSIILNGRYLLALRREATVRINPGQISLFTGRADNPKEWGKPLLIVRELFEELLLFQNDRQYVPQCPVFQSVIDYVYSSFHLPQDSPCLPIHFKTPEKPYCVEIFEQNKLLAREPCYWTINPRGEINLFYVFEAQIEVDTLSARDGEMGRDVIVLDCQAGLQGIMQGGSWPRQWHTWDETQFSSNLTWLLKQLGLKPERSND